MRKSEAQNGNAAKTSTSGGSDPICSAFSRPDMRGVTPALVTHSACIALAAFARIEATNLHCITHYNLTERGELAVPVLKAPPKQSKNEPLQLRVSTEFKSKLQSYAEFLNATPSYIVTEALDRIFRKDHEFRAWLQQHSESASANQTESNSNLEIKKES